MRDSVVSMGLLGSQTKANLLKNKKMFNFVPTFREATAEKAHNGEYASHLHLTTIPLEKHRCLKIQFKTRAMISSVLSSRVWLTHAGIILLIPAAFQLFRLFYHFFDL